MIKLFHIFILLVVLLTSCTTVFPGFSKSDKLEYILRRGKLVISTEANYPPQSQRVEGETRPANTKCSPTEFTANQFTGFDIEVAVEIAHQLGVEACFVTPNWEQVLSGNWNDHWDINISSMTITTGRMEVLYFPQPYSTGPAVFLVQKDDLRFSTPSDLTNKKIGVCADCVYEDYLDGTLDLPDGSINFVVQNPIIVAYKKDNMALALLARGNIGGQHQDQREWHRRLDAVLIDQVDGMRAIENGLPLKQLGEPVFSGYSAVAIDKQSSHDQIPFVQKVNEIIQAMHRDGFLREKSLQYYEIDLATTASQFDIRTLGQLP